jgi:hypothetical protein
MAEIGNTTVFSQTDASNTSGTVPTWSENMAPSQVNDSARALQGAVTREWNWRNVTLTSGGSADTQTLTYSVAPAALYNGQRFAFIAGFTNTGAMTLNVNSLGATAVKKMVAGVQTALSAGDITASNFYEVAYNSSGSAFIIMITTGNGAPATLSGTNAFTGANTFANDSTFNNLINITEDVRFSGDISPTQLTANQDDWAPTGHATASVFRVTTDATVRTITGITGGADGRLLLLVNANSSTAFILADETTSTAANQIMTPNSADYYVRGGGAVLLWYDSTSSRWRILQPFDLASQSTMESAASPVSTVSPLNQHYHPGHPKFWAYVTVSGGTPTLQTSYNVTSITDTATGKLTVTIATDFSSANWCCQATAGVSVNTDERIVFEDSDDRAAGVCAVMAVDIAGGLIDPVSWSIMGLGDQ